MVNQVRLGSRAKQGSGAFTRYGGAKAGGRIWLARRASLRIMFKAQANRGSEFSGLDVMQYPVIFFPLPILCRRSRNTMEGFMDKMNENASNSQQKKVVDLANINSEKATNVISKASGKRQILINSPETNLEGIYAVDIEKSSGRTEIENEDKKSDLLSMKGKSVENK
jgi:hypothetical protein